MLWLKNAKSQNQFLRKTARAFHNQNVTDLIAEVSDIEALMESI